MASSLSVTKKIGMKTLIGIHTSRIRGIAELAACPNCLTVCTNRYPRPRDDESSAKRLKVTNEVDCATDGASTTFPCVKFEKAFSSKPKDWMRWLRNAYSKIERWEHVNSILEVQVTEYHSARSVVLCIYIDA